MVLLNSEQEIDSSSTNPSWYAALLLWLSIQHQNRQETIAAELAKQVRRSWNILNPRDLDSNSIEWAQTTVDAMRRAFEDSQHASDTFVREVRTLGVPDDAPLLPGHLLGSESVHDWARPLSPHRAYLVGDDTEILPLFNEREAGLRILSRGPAYVKHQMPAPLDEAMDSALVNVEGEAIAAALQGGRDLVRTVVERDRLALGWRRVTDSDPCDFCALLASRGTVYKSGSFIVSDEQFDPPENMREFVDGELPAKVHNHCRCSIMPVYDRSQRFSDEALEWRRLWVVSTAGLRGQAARAAWRAAYRHKLFGKQELNQLSIADAETLLSRIERELKRRGDRDKSPSALLLRDQAKTLRAVLG